MSRRSEAFFYITGFLSGVTVVYLCTIFKNRMEITFERSDHSEEFSDDEEDQPPPPEQPDSTPPAAEPPEDDDETSTDGRWTLVFKVEKKKRTS